MKDNEYNKIVQNLRMITIMKSCGYTDGEIARYLGLSVKEFLDIMFGDDYLKESYEKAANKLGSEIEQQFIINTMKAMAKGDNTDAKWYLERTNPKYVKRDQVDVSGGVTIDEIIRHAGE